MKTGGGAVVGVLSAPAGALRSRLGLDAAVASPGQTITVGRS